MDCIPKGSKKKSSHALGHSMENEVITIVYDDTPVEHYLLKTQQ